MPASGNFPCFTSRKLGAGAETSLWLRLQSKFRLPYDSGSTTLPPETIQIWKLNIFFNLFISCLFSGRCWSSGHPGWRSCRGQDDLHRYLVLLLSSSLKPNTVGPLFCMKHIFLLYAPCENWNFQPFISSYFSFQMCFSFYLHSTFLFPDFPNSGPLSPPLVSTTGIQCGT